MACWGTVQSVELCTEYAYLLAPYSYDLGLLGVYQWRPHSSGCFRTGSVWSLKARLLWHTRESGDLSCTLADEVGTYLTARAGYDPMAGIE